MNARAWTLAGEPLALRRFVHPDAVGRLLGLPDLRGTEPVTRLRRVYTAIAERGVTYVPAPADAQAGTQLLRPPDQVLWAPRHGTCLDLALVLAAALLHADLHPVIAILDPPTGPGVGHAVVLVRLGDDDRPAAAPRPRSDGHYDQDVWTGLPADWADATDSGSADFLGDVVAIDPIGLAVPLGPTPVPGLRAGLEDAVRNGARYLAEHPWRVGVDIGTAGPADTGLPDTPRTEPLRAPYRTADRDQSPLRLLRAEYQLVGFRSRDELTVLRSWCRRIAAGDTTGLAVVTGIGGAGKTRLALELAHQLGHREGWYTGTLPRTTDPAALGWLATVVSPVLVVVDYADGRVADTTALLAALRARAGPPAVVVLTARSLDGDWLPDIRSGLQDDAHLHNEEIITLPDTHPDPSTVYARTVAALTPGQVSPPPVPSGIRWTTLDFVLLGWIAARGDTELPHTRDGLYDIALRHEQDYWVTVYRDLAHHHEPRRARLRRAAACLSLTAAPEHDADRVLRAVPDLRDDAPERRTVRDTLTTCLRPGPGEALAVRPDPIGDHLVLTELDDDPDLLTGLLDPDGGHAPDQARVAQALETLQRAGQHRSEPAVRLITRLLDHDIELWPLVVAAAQARGGAAEAALLDVAGREDTHLPLDDVTQQLPFSQYSLYELAVVVDDRRLRRAIAAAEPDTTVAGLHERLGERARLAGHHAQALEASTGAVGIRRRLADADPAAHLPDLAMSLNNLSNQQSNTGDYDGALVSSTEAVEHYRRFAEADPAAHLSNLASALNNLSNRQSSIGDYDGALVSSTEAVGHYRRLAEVNPGVYMPSLASALNNLSNQQSDTGDYDDALVSITEAVGHYRRIADANPAAYLSNLATSLNNLSNRQSDVGDHGSALASVTEAVEIRRRLAGANPAAHLSDLAMSLNNLSNQQSSTGDRDGALVSITEAVGHFRRLADANPAAHLPYLATSLNNLCVQQGDVGDYGGALASIIEAVEIRRRLAKANLAAHLPDLATSLNNLSVQQGNAGDYDGALVSITEAVEHYRRLIEANPAVYMPSLANALNNLSNQQSDAGDYDGALVSITEAVGHFRRLADANLAAYLPYLATSLNNLSNRRSDIGDRDGALTSITEAVEIRRRLAEANPAVYTPSLANALNNLSNQQSDIGDRDGALVSITEAVGHYRRLAAAYLAAYLPDLAMSLNNLSNQQSDTGDRDGALVSITEAVGHYRRLAAAHPVAHLPSVATALNNLSVQQGNTGDYDGALTSITEAVEIRRRLADANPAAHLADLASSLNNLSSQQGNTGDNDGALVSITESVELRRRLTRENPAAYLPDLAMSLNNYSNRQFDIGDRDGALTSIAEAVEIRRRLADANPAAYLPSLATSLNNLSNQQSSTGDRDGALTSVTEAVEIRRRLAAANATVYLPDLAMSLNDLSNQQLNVDAGAVQRQWEAAIRDLPVPAARAELRAAFAQQFLPLQRLETDQQLRLAAAEADEHVENNGPPDRASLLVSRARLAVRDAVTAFGDVPADLPAWALTPLPAEHLELVNAYAGARDWPSREAALDSRRPILLSSEFLATLTALTELYPDKSAPADLKVLLNGIADHGVDAVFAALTDRHHRSKLVNDWIATTTWTDSRDFLDEHRHDLADETGRTILADIGDDNARQHLAVLDLCSDTPTTVVYGWIVDSAAAEEAALDAIDNGDLNRLQLILTAAPRLRRETLTFALAATAILLAIGNTTEAHRSARVIAAKAGPLQRWAHTTRLESLRTSHPHLADQFDEVIAIINAVDIPETAE